MTLEDSLSLHTDRLHPHSHPFFQVFLMSGTGTLMHDFIDHEINGHALAFTSPGQIHAIKPGHDMTGMLVSFTQAFFDNNTPPPSRLLDFPFFFSAGLPPLLRLRPEEYENCNAAFQELYKEFEANLFGARDVVRAFLEVIFTRSARLFLKMHRLENFSRPAQLVRSFRISVENRFRELTFPADYANLLEVTVNHLNDVVRDQTGQTAGEIIRERRLLDAKRQLLHSELSVSEIAYHLSFADPSYFSRFFKRYVGQSPADFRELIREKYQRSAS